MLGWLIESGLFYRHGQFIKRYNNTKKAYNYDKPKQLPYYFTRPTTRFPTVPAAAHRHA